MNSSYSQDSIHLFKKEKKDYQNWNLNYSVGISFQKHFFGEVGINYGKFSNSGPCASGNTKLIRLTTEFTVFEGKAVFAPKLGFEFSLLSFFLLRNSCANYNIGNYNDTRLISEFGFGTKQMTLLFGWNIPFDKTRKQEFISNNRLGLTYNF